jgi:flavin reductase (DIM6/NTAB) family NADH-FMN oxidoreductase RutF
VKSDLVDAPYMKEFPLVIECKVIKVVEIGLHTEFIGEIVDVKADSFALEENLPDIEKNQTDHLESGIKVQESYCYYN